MFIFSEICVVSSVWLELLLNVKKYPYILLVKEMKYKTRQTCNGVNNQVWKCLFTMVYLLNTLIDYRLIRLLLIVGF